MQKWCLVAGLSFCNLQFFAADQIDVTTQTDNIYRPARIDPTLRRLRDGFDRYTEGYWAYLCQKPEPLPAIGVNELSTQTDLYGPHPSYYTYWKFVREAFDKAVIEETWTKEKFEEAFKRGDIVRWDHRCIDENFIPHLIEVEEADLQLSEISSRGFARIIGFSFKKIRVTGCTNVSGVYRPTFGLCRFEEIEILRADQINFDVCDFRNAKVDCSGGFWEHENSRFENSLLAGARFNNALGAGLVFKGCDLHATSFESSNDLKFWCRDCDLSNSSLSCEGRCVTQCQYCALNWMTFKVASEHGCLLGECDLSGVSFEGNKFSCGIASIASSFMNCRYSSDTNFRDVRAPKGLRFFGNAPNDADFDGAVISNLKLEAVCPVKLVGKRYFDSEGDPVKGAMLVNLVELSRCSNYKGELIPDCKIPGKTIVPRFGVDQKSRHSGGVRGGDAFGKYPVFGSNFRPDIKAPKQ